MFSDHKLQRKRLSYKETFLQTRSRSSTKGTVVVQGKETD